MLSHVVGAAGNVESDGSVGGALVAGIEGEQTELWVIIARLLSGWYWCEGFPPFFACAAVQ